MSNSVQTKGIGNKRAPSGICYAIIPEGVDRDTYVQNCLRRGVVSIQVEDYSVVFDCPVLSILQLIDFPLETKQLGSALVYVTEYNHNKPIIIDRLLKIDESTNYIENEFKLEKYTENGSVIISGVAKDGNLFINVSGKGENGGKVFIDVAHPDNEGEIIVNLKGNFQMELQAMVLNVLKGFNVTTKEDININADGEAVINLGSVGEGVEPILLGTITQTEIDKTNNLLQNLITIINGSPIPEPGSGSPSALQTALAAAISGQSLGDFSNIKSEKTFSE